MDFKIKSGFCGFQPGGLAYLQKRPGFDMFVFTTINLKDYPC